MKNSNSEKLYDLAKRFIPGGVNSPVRGFSAVGGTPRFIDRGEGACLWDVDGNRYVDYVLSWGPLVMGHAHPRVVEAIRSAAEKGTSFGAPTSLEVELAQLVSQVFPAMELVRFVNSGTEATMSAIRLARAFTGRDKIVKFEGHYHGHADAFLVKAGSGAATLGLPDSPGVPAETTGHTISAPYNDLSAVDGLFQRYPGQIAAIIVEPVAGNMGLVLPEPGFLSGLQDLCRRNGALFILDEVMTGFRVSPGGAQQAYTLQPDLTTLGKVIGGGLPVGAYGGRREIMSMVAPAGKVYQAGTLSGNPLAMAAGLATVNALLEPGVFAAIVEKTQMLVEGMRRLGEKKGLALQTGQAGTMFGLFFLKKSGAKIRDYAGARAFADVERYARFFHGMLERGFYFPPGQFEACFMSTAHTEKDIRETLAAAYVGFGELDKAG